MSTKQITRTEQDDDTIHREDHIMSMQRTELEAWLGPALDDMTDEQVDTFAALVERIAGRYPGRDSGQHPDEEAMGEAMSGALMILLGDDTLAGLGGEWARARQAEREAMARLTGAIIAASGAGRAETEIAAETGLTRRSVRKALGK